MMNRLSPPCLHRRSLSSTYLHATLPADYSYPAEWDVFEPKPIIRITVERCVVEKNREQEEMQKSTRTSVHLIIFSDFKLWDNVSIAPCYESQLQ